MKKWILGLLFLASAGWAATTQAHNLGVVNFSLNSQTQSVIDNSTSSAKGQLVFCNNCGGAGGAGTICISTQTTGFHGFVLSTGTICK